MPLGVWEIIILKASQLLYNVLCVSLHPSIDVKKRDIMLLTAEVATYITLSSVRFGWWKLVTVSDWKIRNQLFMTRNVVRIVSLKYKNEEWNEFK